jgi:hypothetical protein
MDLPPLYAASVPVFRHDLGRAQEMIARATPDQMQARIGDGFPAGQQFCTAAGLTLGKADFDGFHAYPADFRFSDPA